MVNEIELQRYIEKYRKKIKTTANELLFEKMPACTEELFGAFEQTGNRIEYEKIYFRRRKFLAFLGLEVCIQIQESEEQDVSKEILEKLCATIKEICEEKCWELPAHINRQKNPEWTITVGLFAAETAQTLAELSDRLRKILPENIRHQMVLEIKRRVLRPFFESKVPYDRGLAWEQCTNNWNAVCNGAIGSACLHILKEQPEILNGCLQRICKNLEFYLDGFSDDGVCLEGVGYYNYGMGYFCNFAQELFEYTDEQRDLFCGAWGKWTCGENDKRYKIAQFLMHSFFADGKNVIFADGNCEEKFHAGTLGILSMHYPDIVFPRIELASDPESDGCYRFAILKSNYFDLLKYLRAITHNGDKPVNGVEKLLHRGTFQIFPLAQWCIGNSVNGVGFACKGGHNEEPHNHNDIGQFIWQSKGSMFLTDLGAGEYTRDYFGEKRYEIFCNSSFSHNVPLIEGNGQANGANYHCRSFWASPDGYVKMELGGAYQNASEIQIDRELHFDLEKGNLELCDKFESEGENLDVAENLVTQIPPKVHGNQILLEKGDVKAVIHVATSQESIQILVEEHEHVNHSGVAELVYTMRWKVEMKDCAGWSRVLFEIVL